ncbi:hypothetical protein ACFPK9_03000 [Rubritalea spongiae]|uniref:DUF3352 domain-containing protein n=1 Tax=Rubritalea spongiae TaxID=430797 RepID=A0ABW5E4M7_9BACT
MKSPYYFVLPLVASAAFLPSCKKSNDHVDGDVVGQAVEVLEEKVHEEEKVDHLKKLAEKAGFAVNLPKDTSAFWTLYDGAGLLEKLRNSSVGKYLNTLAEQDGESLDDLFEDPDFAKFMEVAGEELFFAVGTGAPDQTGHLLEVSALSNYHQMRSMVELLGASLGEGNEESYDIDTNYIDEWLKDPRMLELFEQFSMPPMYFGFKLSDEEKRKAYLNQIKSSAQMLVEMQSEGEVVFETVESEVYSGLAVRGEKFAEMLKGEEGAEMRATLSEDAYTSFIKSAEEKDVVALIAEKGDYLVFFIGSAEEEFKFAESAEESVLAHDEMASVQQYSDKDLISLIFMEEALGESFIDNQSGMQDMALGVLDGLKETDAFGDTRVLEGLLADLIDREKAYYETYEAGLSTMAVFHEEGIKAESFYTGNYPELDLEAKRKLSKVGDGDGVLFSANWVNNPAQAELALEYVDSLGSTVYQMVKQLSGLNFEESDLTEYTASFSMVDGMFKNDLMQLWSALRDDLNDGLGAESAVVIDINGELPTAPMIPEDVLKNGKLPRMSYLSTVKDRSKLAASWEKINSTAERLLKQAGVMTGTPIPMQRPFKSESNGLTSWTFQIPFAHQNCTPSVSVSDDLFIMGSSSDFANQLAAQFSKEEEGEAMAEFAFHFDPLRELSSNWLELVAKHGADFMDETEYANFQEAQPVLEGLIEASESIESLSLQTKQVDGGVQSSFHFKLR